MLKSSKLYYLETLIHLLYQYDVLRKIRNVNSTCINENMAFIEKPYLFLSVKNMSQNLND